MRTCHSPAGWALTFVSGNLYRAWCLHDFARYGGRYLIRLPTDDIAGQVLPWFDATTSIMAFETAAVHVSVVQ